MLFRSQYEDITISGVIGKPEIARSNRSHQLFFVNKRYIKDKTLTAATEQAYKGLIPIGKFGFVILNMEMNPAKVDVNVHPAKLEVRFEEENKIFQSIYHAIKDTLLKSELVTNSSENPREVSFEERLQNLREAKKEKQSGGLFGFRKQNEKQIEKYTEEESEIKTNHILEETKKESKIKVGTPIDTSDVLKQLREMKEKIEKEIQEKQVTPATLKEPEITYQLEKKGEKIEGEKTEEKIEKVEEESDTETHVEEKKEEETNQVEKIEEPDRSNITEEGKIGRAHV